MISLEAEREIFVRNFIAYSRCKQALEREMAIAGQEGAEGSLWLNKEWVSLPGESRSAGQL